MEVYIVRDEDKLILGIYATQEAATKAFEKAKKYCIPAMIVMRVLEA